MQIHPAKRVEIVIEAPLERRLTQALTEGVVARTLPVLLGRPFPDRLDGVDAAQIK
jgi:hypothetical protein